MKKSTKSHTRAKKPTDRLQELEDAILSIHSHLVSVDHHSARIDAIIRSLFSKSEFVTKTQTNGQKLDPKHAKKLYGLMMLHQSGG